MTLLIEQVEGSLAHPDYLAQSLESGPLSWLSDFMPEPVLESPPRAADPEELKQVSSGLNSQTEPVHAVPSEGAESVFSAGSHPDRLPGPNPRSPPRCRSHLDPTAWTRKPIQNRPGWESAHCSTCGTWIGNNPIAIQQPTEHLPNTPQKTRPSASLL